MPCSIERVFYRRSVDGVGRGAWRLGQYRSSTFGRIANEHEVPVSLFRYNPEIHGNPEFGGTDTANPRTDGNSPPRPRYQLSELGTYVQRGYEADSPSSVPSNVNVDNNIRDAIAARVNGGMSPWWFYDQVKNGGPWDYKQQGAQYQDFGNFNYGATGAAFGFSEDTLARMAGWAQVRASTSRPDWGVASGLPGAVFGLGGKSPFGDDPVDNYWIKQGIRYFNERSKGQR